MSSKKGKKASKGATGVPEKEKLDQSMRETQANIAPVMSTVTGKRKVTTPEPAEENVKRRRSPSPDIIYMGKKPPSNGASKSKWSVVDPVIWKSYTKRFGSIRVAFDALAASGAAELDVEPKNVAAEKKEAADVKSASISVPNNPGPTGSSVKSLVQLEEATSEVSGKDGGDGTDSIDQSLAQSGGKATLEVSGKDGGEGTVSIDQSLSPRGGEATLEVSGKEGGERTASVEQSLATRDGEATPIVVSSKKNGGEQTASIDKSLAQTGGEATPKVSGKDGDEQTASKVKPLAQPGGEETPIVSSRKDGGERNVYRVPKEEDDSDSDEEKKKNVKKDVMDSGFIVPNLDLSLKELNLCDDPSCESCKLKSACIVQDETAAKFQKNYNPFFYM